MSAVTATHIQKLTAHVWWGVVAHADFLVTGSEEAGPLVAPGVAELRVVLQNHLPGTYLLQRAQTQPAEVLRLHHYQTVLTGEERYNVEVNKQY